jgi:hypothetical protein
MEFFLPRSRIFSGFGILDFKLTLIQNSEQMLRKNTGIIFISLLQPTEAILDPE